MASSHMSSSLTIRLCADEEPMTENTTKKVVEKEQSSVAPIMSHHHHHQTQLSSVGSKHISTIQNAAEHAKFKASPEKGASFIKSMTKNVCHACTEFSNPCMIADSFTEATDVEKSPMTDTDLSEPKTGTTTASYRTGASSPDFSIQHQTGCYLQQRTSFEDKKDRPSITHAKPVQAYSFLDFAYLAKKITNVDELVIMDSQDPHEDHINVEQHHESPSMWANEVADSCSIASSPDCPQPQESVETGRDFENILPKEQLAKATSTPVYNPLAAEWCPGNQQKQEGFVEVRQIRSDRPRLKVTVGGFSPSIALGQKGSPSLQSGNSVHRLKPRFGEPDGTTPSGEKSTSTVSIHGRVSNSLNNANEEPCQAGVHTTQRNAALPDKINLHDRPTLAQRRAERQFAQTQIGTSQAAPSTIKPLPASLCIAQEPVHANKANSARAGLVTERQPGQYQIISHSQSQKWKSLANSEIENPSLHPELAKWVQVEQDLLRMGLIKRVPGKPDGGSFVVPKNFEQWLEFRAGRTEDLLLQSAAKIHSRNTTTEAAIGAGQNFSVQKPYDTDVDNDRHRKVIRVGPVGGGKEYHDGRSTVLAHLSTWSPWYKPTEDRPEALWPCTEEMREEGDERHTSAFGRFLALPRVPGNPTVVWKVKPLIPALPFDEVWKLPNKDTWADLHGQKPDDSQEEYMKSMVGLELLDAIDC